MLHNFLNDQYEVREGIAENLHKFLKVLSVKQRDSCVDKIADREVNKQDWRKRVEQAHQIKKMAKVFSCQAVCNFYMPLFFQLCQDQVAEVRLEAAKATKNIACKMQEG